MINYDVEITKRKDGRFSARITLEKGKKKYFYGKSNKEVKNKIKEFKKSRKNNFETEESFDDLILKWLKLYKRPTLKPSSYDRLESIIEAQINPQIGHMIISDITDDYIQENLINKKAEKYSYSTVKKIYTALSNFYRYYSKKTGTQNIMENVVLPSQNKFKTKNIEILSEDEVKKLIEIADIKYKNGKKMYTNGAIIPFMIYTGLRMGETIALKWENIDIENKKITINSNAVIAMERDNEGNAIKSNIIIQESTKTKNGEREIPLSDIALNSLEKLKETNRSNTYVLATENGNLLKPNKLQDLYDAMLKRAGISHKGIHSTRHTFASMLFKKGVDVKIISELLGHSDIKITYNIYIHLIKEQKTDILNILNETNIE